MGLLLSRVFHIRHPMLLVEFLNCCRGQREMNAESPAGLQLASVLWARQKIRKEDTGSKFSHTWERQSIFSIVPDLPWLICGHVEAGGESARARPAQNEGSLNCRRIVTHSPARW